MSTATTTSSQPAPLDSCEMPSPDEIFAQWQGILDNDFTRTITQTFALPPPETDTYTYRADSFAMTLSEIQTHLSSNVLKYKYQSHGKQIEVPSTDIAAYTTIFSPATSTSKALTSFASNAKKGSPRETVAKYLSSRYLPPQTPSPSSASSSIPRSKSHVNPYYDLWVLSCHLTSFLGPLPDAAYAAPESAKVAHPILPVFYHHFGCVVPTWEVLCVIKGLVVEGSSGCNEGVLDLGSGNGYWTYMLRRMGLDVVAVDSLASAYRTMWIGDTVKADGVDYLRSKKGGSGRVLLCVYPVTQGRFLERVVRTYKGDVVVAVGTQNANRFTGFSDCGVEEWFGREMKGWQLWCRILMPSFAGKDEAMFVWKKRK